MIELAARQLEAGGHFRQQAVVTHGEYRCGRALFAVFQYGGGNAHLHYAADLAEGVRHFGVGSFVVADRQQAVADAAVASIQLDPAIGEGIGAEADDALGETGGEVEHGAVCPRLAIAVALIGRLGAVAALAVAAAMAEIAVHVEVAVEQIQAAVLDKAVGFLLLTGHGQLRGGGDRQG